jgi:hypothetical protein
MQGRSREPFWKSSVELRMVGRVGADFRFASIWSTGDAGPRLHRQFPYKATNSYQQNAPAPHCFEDALSVLLVDARCPASSRAAKDRSASRARHPRSRRADRQDVDVEQPCAGRLKLTLRLTRRRRQQRRDLIPRARPRRQHLSERAAAPGERLCL